MGVAAEPLAWEAGTIMAAPPLRRKTKGFRGFATSRRRRRAAGTDRRFLLRLSDTVSLRRCGRGWSPGFSRSGASHRLKLGLQPQPDAEYMGRSGFVVRASARASSSRAEARTTNPFPGVKPG